MFDDTSKRNSVGNYNILNTSLLLKYLYRYIGSASIKNQDSDLRDGWLMIDMRYFLNPGDPYSEVFKVIEYGCNCSPLLTY